MNNAQSNSQKTSTASNQKGGAPSPSKQKKPSGRGPKGLSLKKKSSPSTTSATSRQTKPTPKRKQPGDKPSESKPNYGRLAKQQAQSGDTKPGLSTELGSSRPIKSGPKRRLQPRKAGPHIQKNPQKTLFDPAKVSFNFPDHLASSLESHLGNEQVQLSIKEAPEDHELELRLGSYPDSQHFQAYVSLLDFSRIYGHYIKEYPEYHRTVTLDMYYDRNYRISLFGETPENSKNEIEYFCQTNHLRRARFVEKNLILHDNSPDWQYRLTSSKDREIKDQKLIEVLTKKIEDRTVSKYYRYKNRYSFQLSPELQLDLTVCKESPHTAGTFQNSYTLDQKEKYQVELEFTGKNFLTEHLIQVLTPAITNLLKIYQNSLRPLSQSHGQLVLSNFLKLTTGAENLSIEDLTSRPNLKFTALDPIPLTRQNFYHLARDYLVTVKADGSHHLLYVDPEQGAYLINNRLQPSPAQLPVKDLKAVGPALFDGELVVSQGKSRFLIFDVFFYQGRDLRSLPLFSNQKASGGRLQLTEQTRFHWAKEFMKLIANDVLEDELVVQVKDYYNFADPRLKRLFKDEFTKMDDSLYPYGIDGLILMPYTVPYPKVEYDMKKRFFERPAYTKDAYKDLAPILKWKPPAYLSIDFKVNFGKEKKIRNLAGGKYLEVTLESSYGSQIYPFNPAGYRLKDYNRAYLPLNESMQPKLDHYESVSGAEIEDDSFLGTDDQVPVDPDSIGYTVKNGDILEFIWIPDRRFGDDYWGRWFPIKFREDKTQIGFPNNYYVANQTWQMIHDIQITPKMILGMETSPQLDLGYYQKQNRLDLPHIRNVHNSIKSVLIFLAFYNSSRPQSLLDFASGRGGDLHKWKIGIKYVLGIELDEANLKSGKASALGRYYEMICDYYRKDRRAPPLNIDFVQGNMGRSFSDRNFSDETVFNYLLKQNTRRPEQFGIVTCMFALHYICDTDEHIHNFFENVGDNLAPGGYFVATTFDGEKVFKALKRNKDGIIEGKENNQEIWRIVRKYSASENFAKYGQKISVYNPSISEDPQVEFLVNFNYLAEVAQKYNLVPNVLNYQNRTLPLDGNYGVGDFSELYTDEYADLLKTLNIFSGNMRRRIDESFKNISKDALEYSQYSSFLIFKKQA